MKMWQTEHSICWILLLQSSREKKPKMLVLGVILLALTPCALGASLAQVATMNGCGKIVGLIQAAGLDTALAQANGVTLFAPSDAAVDAVPASIMTALSNDATLLQQVLTFHVVSQVAMAAAISNNLLLPTLEPSGAQMRMNVYTLAHQAPIGRRRAQDTTVVTAEGATVSRTDLQADNGVVHVIDKVIYPLPLMNIPLTATFDPELAKLAYMVQTANLIEALAGSDFTVFAPTNDALNKLDGQLFQNIVTNLTLLKEVLFTHVVPGVVFISGLEHRQTFTNLQGTQLEVVVGNNGVTVNHDSTVTRADVPASNGVIHVIDTVIMPV